MTAPYSHDGTLGERTQSQPGFRRSREHLAAICRLLPRG